MVQCALCKSTGFEFVYKDRALLKCSRCGLVRTKKAPKQDYKTYHRDGEYAQNQAIFRNIFLKRYKIISKLTQECGQVLEIGCSTGVFLEIFKQNGWNVLGIEPSESGSVAKSKGIKIIKNSFENAKINQKFDLIIMNHTLEHVADPTFVLTKARKLLTKSGLLFIDVPNFDSFSSKLFGKNWKYLLPEEHVHHFTKRTLEKCLTKSGLKPIYTNTWTGIFDIDSPLKKIFTQLSSGKPYLYKSLVLDLLNIPLDIISTHVLKNGTNLVVIAENK